MAGPASDPQRVFVNCPLDARYKPLFDATVFAIHDLGFQARHAPVAQVPEAVRLTRIADELGACRYSIHDLSRVETGGGKRLPCFNMPFEAGIAYGLHHFAVKGSENHLLLLDAEPHRWQASLSDAAGLDPGVHGNEPGQVIARVRAFLARERPPGPARCPAHLAQVPGLPGPAACDGQRVAGDAAGAEIMRARQRPAGRHGELHRDQPGVVAPERAPTRRRQRWGTSESTN